MTSIVRTARELAAWRAAMAPRARVAFVPTMGFLHAGHVSLLQEARRRVPESDGVVVLSIFVNPTQFGPHEDLDRYPRDEPGDLAKAAECAVDVAFCPLDVDALYPTHSTWVDVEGLADGLCGRSRPGHFRGVCTVVAKLWNLVRPDISVFGQKDYQQLAILRRMHADMFFPGKVVGMPIVRESDGLALSSRNAHLSDRGRGDARAIPRFLTLVSERFRRGERSAAALVGGAESALSPGRIDYVEVVDAASLAPVGSVVAPALVAVAVVFEGVRLIDNVILTP